MAINTPLCKFNLYGHCKFGDKCEKRHIENTCDQFPCLIEDCSGRHPPMCKYFDRYGLCKFKDECSYLHLSKTDNFGKLEDEIESLRKEIENLKIQNNLLQSLSKKIDCVESKINEIEVDIRIQNDNSKLRTLFSCDKCEQSFDSNKSLTNHKQTVHVQVRFKCDVCGYQSSSKKGLNIHKGSKHKHSVKTNLKQNNIEGDNLQPPIPCIRDYIGCKI